MKRLLMLAFTVLPLTILAQDTTVKTSSFSFEDIDNTPVKVFCTQKVLNQSPTKFISVGYEYQFSSNLKAISPAANDVRTINAMQGLRLNFNTPVVSKNKIIVSVGGQYARTSFQGTNQSAYPLYPVLLNDGLHTAGINSTIFKPLNSKNFVIVQASADANWLASGLKDVDTKSITVSGSLIYGWKKSDNEMFGLGVTRTYRLGRLIHIPIILYNKTFNEKWGVEATFPAKVHLRRNINAKSMLQLGYEIEGNQYALYNNSFTTPRAYLQRGEFKPRLMYERSLAGFWWLSIQAGARVNGRFNVVDSYYGMKENQIITNSLGSALYFNVSLNLVSL